MESTKEKLWNRYFIIACFATIFTGMCMRMLDSNLASFAAVTFNSKALGGYLTSAFNIGSIVMAFFSGRIVDKLGRQKCYVAGALLFGISTVACAIWPTAPVTLAVRFIQGVAKGVTVVAAAAIVSDVIPRSRMGEGMGLYGLGSTISTAFGPMLALALTANGNYPLMFIVCAICYGFAAVFGVGMNYEKKEEYQAAMAATKAKKSDKSTKQYKGIWTMIEKKALPASLNYTLCFGGYACVLVFVTVYAQEILQLPSTKISLFYTVSAVMMLFLRLFGGKISDKYGSLAMLIPCHLLIILMLVILAFFAKGHYGLFLLCGALYGCGTAGIMPTFQAAAIVDSPSDRNATASATFGFLMDFGIMIASAAFGPVIDNALTPELGYRKMYLISIGVVLCSLVLSIFLFNNKARARRQADND